jgi:hypothetical protein
VRGIRTVEASFTLAPSLSPHREREPNVKILFTFVLVPGTGVQGTSKEDDFRRDGSKARWNSRWPSARIRSGGCTIFAGACAPRGAGRKSKVILTFALLYVKR